MTRRWRGQKREGSKSSETGSASEDSGSDSFGEEEEHRQAQMLLERGSSEGWEGWFIHILDCFCRFLAVMFVLAGLGLMMALLVYLLASGAMQIKSNWTAYQKGIGSWILWCDARRDDVVSSLKLSAAVDARVKTMYTSVLIQFQDWLLQLVNLLLGFVTGSVSFVIVVLLYMLFWLFQPLPLHSAASNLVQSYMWKKTLVSFLYGSSVAVLLHCMGVDLPVFFGLVAFFFNFVPEIGALISMLAPVPLILLNGNLERPVTWLCVALIGQVCLKLLIGNMLELRLVSADDEMSIHPVWILLSLNYFGFLWGPVGMLVSVPLLATFKSVMISQEDAMRVKQPYLSDIAGSLLACLEGRKRKDGRRRSTWLLPFAVQQREQEDKEAQLKEKEREVEATAAREQLPLVQEQTQAADYQSAQTGAAAAPPAASATEPKKTRQPDA